MSVIEKYLSVIGAKTGDQMKSALFELLLNRYFWTTWNSEDTQKMASSVVNYLFCETADQDEVRYWMTDRRAQLKDVVANCLKRNRCAERLLVRSTTFRMAGSWTRAERSASSQPHTSDMCGQFRRL